jgi:DtxR family transcriptional regulator, Mn-dependent transcriptional regulator
LLLFSLAFFFSPDQGIVLRWLRKIKNQKLEEFEDAVKAVWTLSRAGKLVTTMGLAQQLGISTRKAQNVLGKLDKAEMIQMSDGVASLTNSGDRRALELIRSHRLWERYLVDVGVLDWDEVHEEANRLEHTPTELIEGLAEKMGFPETDPHGAPIPGRKGELPTRIERSLTSLKAGNFARITRIEDEPPAVVAQLKVLGLKPGVFVKVLAHENGAIKIAVESEEQIHLLAREVAENVWINAE